MEEDSLAVPGASPRGATRSAHVSVVVSVGYASNGKPIGVMFRRGYTPFYDYRARGAQVIRDSHGAVAAARPRGDIAAASGWSTAFGQAGDDRDRFRIPDEDLEKIVWHRRAFRFLPAL